MIIYRIPLVAALGMPLMAQQAAAPAMSKTEQLELQNIQLKSELISEQQARLDRDRQDLQTAYIALQAEVKADHPGFELQGDKIVKSAAAGK